MKPVGRQRTKSRLHYVAPYRFYHVVTGGKGAREAEPLRSAAQRATGTTTQPDPCASMGHDNANHDTRHP